MGRPASSGKPTAGSLWSRLRMGGSRVASLKGNVVDQRFTSSSQVTVCTPGAAQAAATASARSAQEST